MSDEPGGEAGAEWRAPHGAHTHRVRRNWLLYSGFFLLYLLEPVLTLLQGDYSPAHRVIGIALVALYAASYLVVVWTCFRASLRRRLVGAGWILAVGTTVGLFLGPDSWGLLTYALATLVVLVPHPWGLVAAGTAALGAFADTFTLPDGPRPETLIQLGTLSLAMVAMNNMVQLNARLRRAGDEIARLAAVEERARVARDLHDVLGHSLTTITVKAGLARRLLETGPTGSERAVAEVGDLERLARQAMTEVRATVSGYREASLPAELAGARVALDAAGIRADLPHAVDDVPPRYQAVFAYVLREGVTNVIRHSGARTCRVRLGPTWLEVADDGTGPGGGDRRSSGLAGLRERLAAVGGTLATGPAPGGGFVLRASAPEAA
ncbi:sensor histidine kinase [Streptoalloteichus tenebrarius]|uniref:sensor histidine kinase n=1 Tax=Streptoalloteichus tenebrarius (strain ATCC 17920 / DSM 40477 / JCM 4838 / CBS 697.72 / NBRC 16177 / NCIMB 11028 / NRRL B-12390 / A12253. 1 / ISP 5477) TaxID=1933 RepID=UPI0020A2CF30|nr:histidine kinase [Streptoalloteichus tenebrarius]